MTQVAKNDRVTRPAYFRAYTFGCFCGRQVHGQYAITATEFREGAKIDPERAVCQQAKGKAAGQPRSTMELHYVGCGRTMAKSDAEFEDQRVMRRLAGAQS